MNRVLINKYLGGSALLWGSLAVTLFAFAWVRVWVVSLLDMSQFKTVLDQFRQFERFAPIDFDSILTYTGRVGMTFDEPVVIFCIVTWAIARGSDVVAGELNRGTLEMLLAQPIRRTTLMLSHAIVAVAGLIGLTLAVWAGLAVGIAVTSVDESVPPPTITVPIIEWKIPIAEDGGSVSVPLSERVETATFAPSVVALFAFGFFVLAMATLASSFERYRWRAIGLTIGTYVIQLVMYGLGKSSESLSWLKQTSFFNAYKPQMTTRLVTDDSLSAAFDFRTPIESGMLPAMFYPAGLILGGVVMYAIALRIFNRRDLPAPL